MVDVAAIAGALQAVKTLSDIAKATLGLRDARLIAKNVDDMSKLASEALQRVIDAQTLIMAINQELAAVQNSERECRRKLVDLVDWNAEKQRYELVTLGRGSLGLRIKEACRGTEPVHYVCPTCLEQNKKSIMQPVTSFRPSGALGCPVCKLVVELG